MCTYMYISTVFTPVSFFSIKHACICITLKCMECEQQKAELADYWKERKQLHVVKNIKINVESSPSTTADVDLESTPVEGPLRHWFTSHQCHWSLLYKLLKKHPPSKTVEEWEEEFKSRLVPPAISLLSYKQRNRSLFADWH